MSCVMRCPACMEEVKREKWSKAQWKNSDPWREGRKCCTVCQKTDTDGRNTWHTDGKLHMRQDEYRAYARVLREGWEQPQQRSRGSKSRGSKRSRSRSPRCVFPAPTYSIWTPEGDFHMSCVMRCPACMEEVKRDKWSKAQWDNWDPWREGRNCCTVCQKTDTDGGNTWHTDEKLHMTEDEYRAYARVLREGWEQSQQRSRGSRSSG